MTALRDIAKLRLLVLITYELVSNNIHTKHVVIFHLEIFAKIHDLRISLNMLVL